MHAAHATPIEDLRCARRSAACWSSGGCAGARAAAHTTGRQCIRRDPRCSCSRCAVCIPMLQPLRNCTAGLAGRQRRHYVALTPGRCSAAASRRVRTSVVGLSRCWLNQSGGTVRVATVIPGLCRPASTDTSGEDEQPRLTRAERRRLRRQQKRTPSESATTSGDVSLLVSQSSTREAAIRLWAKEPVLFESSRTGLVRILSTLSMVQVPMHDTAAIGRAARPFNSTLCSPHH